MAPFVEAKNRQKLKKKKQQPQQYHQRIIAASSPAETASNFRLLLFISFVWFSIDFFYGFSSLVLISIGCNKLILFDDDLFQYSSLKRSLRRRAEFFYFSCDLRYKNCDYFLCYLKKMFREKKLKKQKR